MPLILILTAFAALGVAAFALDPDALVLFVILFFTACAMNAPSDGFDRRALQPCHNRRRRSGL